MIPKQFPIKSQTACLLKWAWSSVYVYQGTTNSCHRTVHDLVENENFGMFHNSPGKLEARTKMINGEWPGKGCEYCRDIEAAGGLSDRVNEHNMLAADHNYSTFIPPELLTDPTAINVTPTMVELYFSNKCNMSCIYCDASLSSLWVAENRIHGDRGGMTVAKADELSKTYDIRLEKFWAWFKENYKSIKLLHVLGGEPFYQDETDQMIDFLLENDVTPGTTIKFFSNLKVNDAKFKRLVTKMKRLSDEKHMNVGITASLDAWGPEQEYVRSGLVLSQWEQNFEYLVNECPWMWLCVNSTISSLSIKVMPALVEKLNQWKTVHPNIAHSFNLLFRPASMDPGIFPAGYFEADMQKILDIMPRNNMYDESFYQQMVGVKVRIENTPHNPEQLSRLKVFLDQMDRRKKTNWRTTFPWLIEILD